MAGTAKDYGVTKIHQGSGDIWVIGGGVADSATPQLTLDATTLTPDSASHPSSVHLGSVDEAITVISKPKPEDIYIDQCDGPVARYNTAINMSIKAAMKDLDLTKIQQACPYATYATAGGYNQLTVGGVLTMSGICIALISVKRAAPTKVHVTILFAATGMLGLETNFGKGKAATYNAQWDALSDPARTAGRQMGVHYETK